MAQSDEEFTQDFEDFMSNPTSADLFDGQSTDTGFVADESYVDPTLTLGADLSQPYYVDTSQQQQQPAAFPPPVPTPTYMQPPPTLTQNIAPNTSMGPSWHPAVGWYYPIVQTVHAPLGSPIHFASRQNFALTPSSIPVTTAAPSLIDGTTRTSRGNRVARKRKYGPAVYLEEQAKNAFDAPHSVDNADYTIEYTSKAKERADRGIERDGHTEVRKRSAGRSGRKQPSVVQACVCSDKAALRIKRPRNAWIIYRSANAERAFKDLGCKDNSKASKVLGEEWQKESQAVKSHYKQLADEEEERHRILYPNYKYKPGINKQNRFGSQSCTCGAYQANKAAQATETAEQDMADEIVVASRYNPPQGYAAASMRQNSHVAYASGALQSEQTKLPGNTRPSKRRRQSSVVEIDDDDAPISKRLRSSPHVSYAELDDFDTLDDLFGQGPYIPAEPQVVTKRRPAPIDTINPQALASETAALPIAVAVADSPARNTRSKSRASQELEEHFAAAIANESSANGNYDPAADFPPFDLDANADLDVDWDKFIADDTFPADDEVIVTRSETRRRTLSRSPPRRSRKTTLAQSPKGTLVKSPSPQTPYSLRSQRGS